MSSNELNPKPTRGARNQSSNFDISNLIINLGGRPSKYDESFPDLLIDHMSKGFSFASFAGVVSVTRDTLYKWVDKHPDFKEAKGIATSRSMLWLEGIMLKHMVHTQRGARVDPNLWKYLMTVRFKEDYTEEVVQHQHQTVTEVTIVEKKRDDE
jgi:hypothetical protein